MKEELRLHFERAEECLNDSDYQPITNINQKTAEKILSRAKEFVEACRQLHI